jgi:hypothetical protein
MNNLLPTAEQWINIAIFATPFIAAYYLPRKKEKTVKRQYRRDLMGKFTTKPVIFINDEWKAGL